MEWKQLKQVVRYESALFKQDNSKELSLIQLILEFLSIVKFCDVMNKLPLQIGHLYFLSLEGILNNSNLNLFT